MKQYRIAPGPPFAWVDDEGEQRTARPPQTTITNPADDLLFLEACENQGQSPRVTLVHSVPWHREPAPAPSSAEAPGVAMRETEELAQLLFDKLRVPDLRELATELEVDMYGLSVKREFCDAIAGHVGPRGQFNPVVRDALARRGAA